MKRTNILFRLTAALLCAVLTVPMVLAHDHPGLPISESPLVQSASAWAVPELEAAKNAGLIYDLNEEDATRPALRETFCHYALQFMQVTERQTMFLQMVRYYMLEKGTNDDIVHAFYDEDPGTDVCTCAHAIGLVEGVGDGRFEPMREITRQEAAVMLARAYRVIGGSETAGEAVSEYDDQLDIADWAAEDIALMRSLGVMCGVGDNRFDPLGTYSIEQCAITFLRLNQYTKKVSRIFSYDQVVEFLESESTNGSPSRGELIRWDGPTATLLYGKYGAVMTSFSELYLVRHDGRAERLDPGVCNTTMFPGGLTANTQIHNVVFSKDGSALSFILTLNEDTVWRFTEEPVVLHLAGDYLITVDTESGKTVATKTG